MSASIIVVVASIFVFADTAPLAGPLLIASIAGLYIPHLRTGAASVPLANISIFGLSAATAAALSIISTPILDSGTVCSAIGAAAIASTAYWYANSALTGWASAIRLDTSVVDSVRTQGVSEWPVLILTVGAGLLGIAVTPRIVVMVISLTAALTVFEIYVRRVGRQIDCDTPMLTHLGALMIGACAAAFHTGVLAAAVAATGAFFFVAGWEPLSGNRQIKGGIFVGALVSSVSLTHFGVPVWAQLLVCTASSLAAIGTLDVRTRAALRKTCLPRLVALGYLIPGRGELVWMASLAVVLHLASDHQNSSIPLVVALVVVAIYCTRVMGLRLRGTGKTFRPTVPRSRVGASH